MKSLVKKEDELLLEERTKRYKAGSFIKKGGGWLLALSMGLQLGLVNAEIAETWPTFQHDSLRTGRTSSEGPLIPNLKWIYYAGSYIFAPVSLDGRGRIYLVTETGQLHIISPEGKAENVIALGSPISSCPTLDRQGNAYIGAQNGMLFCISPEGKIIWRCETKSSISSCTPALGPEGNVYVGTEDGYLWAISPTGQPKWRYPTRSPILSSPAISPAGIIYVISSNGYLWAFNPDGKLALRKDIQASSFSSPAIDNQGKVYIGAITGRLAVVEPDGSVDTIFLTSDIASSPALGPEGEVYIGTDQGLYGLSQKKEWYAKIGMVLGSSPIVDKNGLVYIATRNGQIHCVSPAGTIKWSFDIGFVPTSLTMAQDGTIYVGSRDKNLYAVSSSSAPPVEESIPLAPSQLKQIAQGQDYLKIDWQDNSDNEQGFILERKEGRKRYQKIAALPANTTTYNDPGLKPNTKYCYRLSAYNQTGPSKFTKKIALATPAIPAKPAQPKVLPPPMLTPQKVVPAQPAVPTPVLPAVPAQPKVLPPPMVTPQKVVPAQPAVRAPVLPAVPAQPAVRAPVLPAVLPQPEVLPPPLEAPANLKAEAISPMPGVSPLQIKLTWKDTNEIEAGYLPERKEKGQAYIKLNASPKNATTFSDTGIKPAVTYFYRLRAYTREKYSAYSNEVEITSLKILPDAPSALLALPISKTEVQLEWKDEAANEDGFILERKDEGDKWVEIGKLPADTTIYKDKKLKVQTMYHYRLKAYNQQGNSDYSNQVEVTTYGPPPPAPTNLKVISLSNSQIELSWQDTSKGKAYSKLERKEIGEPYVTIATLPLHSTTYQDTRLLAGTGYIYRLTAFNKSGQSEALTLLVKTKEIVPFLPTRLDAKAISSDKISLCWQDNSENEKGFKIERKQEGEAQYQHIAETGPNNTTCTDIEINPATTYIYRIVAYNDTGQSSYSNEAMATTLDVPPFPPSDLKSVTISSDQIGISWQDNTKNEEGFALERKLNDGSYVVIKQLPANALFFTDTMLLPNSQYSYRLRAYNKIGYSAYCQEVVARTKDVLSADPANLKAKAAASDQVEIQWEDCSNNELGFKIDKKTTDSGYHQLAMVAANVTTYYDTGLQPESTYTYRVCSYNSLGNSPYTEDVTIITPAIVPQAPANLETKQVLRERVLLSWQDTSPTEKGFKLERALEKEGYVQVAVLPANITSYENMNLTPDKTYYYRIKAYNEVGDSAYSNVISARTLGMSKPTPCAMSGFNPQRTGMSPYPGPSSAGLRWSYATPGAINSSAVIGVDGTIYFGSADNKIYALNPNGGLKWKFATGGEIKSSPAISSNRIYCGSYDGRLYCLDFTGKLYWSYPTGSPIASSPAIDSSETVYFTSKNGLIYALSPDGNLKWAKDLKGVDPTSAAISPKGTIYVAISGHNGGLYAFDSSGNLKWRYTLDAEIQSSPVVDPTGPIYLGLSDLRGHHLYCFYPEGGVMWDYVSAHWIKAPVAVDSSGTVYLCLCHRGAQGGKKSKGSLVALNPSGNLLWHCETGWCGSSPIIDSEGKIYVSSDNGAIYSFSPDGYLNWSYSLGTTLNSSPTISEDNVIYIGANNGVFYGLGKGVMPPAKPAKLTAKPKFNNRIVLRWEDKSNNEMGFKLARRCAADKPFTVIANLPFNTTSYEDQNLLPDTTYFYCLRAYNSTGLSSSSNQIQVQTYSPALPAPSQVRIASGQQNQTLFLSWQNPVDKNFSHVRIYRSVLPGELGSLVADGLKVNRYEDKDVVAGLTYYYTIKSVDNRGWQSIDTSQYPVQPTDTTLPEVIKHSPIGQKVPSDSKIMITFNEEMNRTSVQQAFLITPAVMGKDVIGDFNWQGNQLFFTPKGRLESQAIYRASLSSEAKDAAGNSLKGFSWQFETCNLPPIVWSYRPINRKPMVKMGEALLFATQSRDPEGRELSYQWLLDGVNKSKDDRWTYAPGNTDKGTKTVVLKVSDGENTTIQSWMVEIQPQ